MIGTAELTREKNAAMASVRSAPANDLFPASQGAASPERASVEPADHEALLATAFADYVDADTTFLRYVARHPRNLARAARALRVLPVIDADMPAGQADERVRALAGDQVGEEQHAVRVGVPRGLRLRHRVRDDADAVLVDERGDVVGEGLPQHDDALSGAEHDLHEVAPELAACGAVLGASVYGTAVNSATGTALAVGRGCTAPKTESAITAATTIGATTSSQYGAPPTSRRSHGRMKRTLLIRPKDEYPHLAWQFGNLPDRRKARPIKYSGDVQR